MQGERGRGVAGGGREGTDDCGWNRGLDPVFVAGLSPVQGSSAHKSSRIGHERGWGEDGGCGGCRRGMGGS